MNREQSDQCAERCWFAGVRVKAEGSAEESGSQPVAFGPNLYTSRRPKTGKRTLLL